jgi:hypothetical protein
MRKFFQIVGFIALMVSLYIASYAIWRGPAIKYQCDHPYYVGLQNGIASNLFSPLIEIDRSINEFTTDIALVEK